MKHLLLLLLFSIVMYKGFSQPKVFTLEHNGTSSMYYNLDSALKHAQNNDVIYLPGGTINFSGTISKSVSLIGAGYDTDSSLATSPTRLTTSVGRVSFSNGLVNVSVVGIEFMEQLFFAESFSITSISFERCLTSTIYFDGIVQNFYLKECIIKGGIASYGIQNTLANNCIFYSSFILKNATVNNSIFFSSGINPFYYHESSKTTNSTFNSCIIYDASTSTVGFPGGTGNTYNNNVFNRTLNASSPPAGQNNVYGVQLSAIFQNTVSTTYVANNKFHLATNSPAKSVGVGGVDCGIYDGPSPFKEGGVPYNPHIQSIKIPSNTDLDGNLIINIKVKGQID